MAAANVSGGIALLLSHRLKANEVREVLAQTAPAGDSINLEDVLLVALTAHHDSGRSASPRATRAHCDAVVATAGAALRGRAAASGLPVVEKR